MEITPNDKNTVEQQAAESLQKLTTSVTQQVSKDMSQKFEQSVEYTVETYTGQQNFQLEIMNKLDLIIELLKSKS